MAFGMLAAAVGLSIVGADASRQIAKAENRVQRAAAEASNRVRDARNEEAAAAGDLARWVQSVNNQRIQRNTAEALEALTVNSQRQQDMMARGRLADSIAHAEQAGAQAAAAAFNGVGGSVVDNINTSTALRDQLTDQQSLDVANQSAWDSTRRAGSIASQLIGGLDQSLILDNMDHSVAVAQEVSKPSYLSAVLQGTLGTYGITPAGMTALGQDLGSVGGALAGMFNVASRTAVPEGTIFETPEQAAFAFKRQALFSR